MPDYYDAPIVVNPNATSLLNLLVAGAVFDVYAVNDIGRDTPLSVFEALSGAPIAELRSSLIAQLPQFTVEGDPEEVVLKQRGGTFETRVKSAYGMRGPRGESAFETAQNSGFDGTAEQFSEYLSLIGHTMREASIVNGELVVQTLDGEELNLGRVQGLDGRGITAVNVAGGDMVVTLTDGTVINAGSAVGPAGPPVDPSGSTAGQVYTSNGPGDEPSWENPTGGSGIVGAPPTWPSTFPPALHNHDVGDLRSGATPLLTQILTFLRAGSAADARAAIGAGTGSGSSNLQLGTTGTTAAAGNHAHAASTVTVSPSGALTATNVQAALVQLLGMVGSGGSSPFVGGMQVMVWNDGWPAKEDGALMRWWISTNDPDAPMPPMDIGDVWDRHPDALEVL